MKELLLPLLHALYAVEARSTSHLYLLLIILLILTQSQDITASLHK